MYELKFNLTEDNKMSTMLERKLKWQETQIVELTAQGQALLEELERRPLYQVVEPSKTLYAFTKEDFVLKADQYAESVAPSISNPEGEPETLEGFIDFLINSSNPLTVLDYV